MSRHTKYPAQSVGAKAPELERKIFGISIGPKRMYKTAGEAFVERLRFIEFSPNNKDVMAKDNFITSFHRELRSDENVVELLNSALEYANKKQEEYTEKAKLLESNGKNFATQKEVADQYYDISQTITDLISYFEPKPSINE